MISLLLSIAVSAQGGQTAQPVPGPARRTIEVRSRDAWVVVQARLKQLGLAIDAHDLENQALRTKWRHVKKALWLPGLELPAPYAAEKIRFIVFVSRFVEPAHVSVGSEMVAVGLGRSGWQTATIYNDNTANEALMSELAKAMAAASVERFAGNPDDPCLSAPRAGANGGGPPLSQPKPIALSVVKTPFPGPAVAARRGGIVVLELEVAADGSVVRLRTNGPPQGDQLEEAALGAASLLLYEPLLLNGCPLPWILNYTANFRLVER